ncbi:hypothetical protein NDU88_003513 [Pleurodeles waltl]|uniref:Uncharacterized protein n=1 Tax=Pleurodeles waltl TaxID=8319 RepID=A0AAV7TPU0_PLEWA|nr:hypothetical protein NDU88_003513 [Pleurodeles waltl]
MVSRGGQHRADTALPGPGIRAAHTYLGTTVKPRDRLTARCLQEEEAIVQTLSGGAVKAKIDRTGTYCFTILDKYELSLKFVLIMDCVVNDTWYTGINCGRYAPIDVSCVTKKSTTVSRTRDGSFHGSAPSSLLLCSPCGCGSLPTLARLRAPDSASLPARSSPRALRPPPLRSAGVWGRCSPLILAPAALVTGSLW